MGPINLLGPTPLPEPAVPELSPAATQALAGGLPIVDGRPRAAFAAGHIPGALGIELGDDFATWARWLLPFNSPLVLVLDREQDVGEAITQLGRVGFDRVRGALRGMEAWRREGLPVAAFTAVDTRHFTDAVMDGMAQQVLDVRAPAEWEAGHLEGSIHRYLPDLLTGIPQEIDRTEPVWLACAAGFRATIAAGILERAGYRPVVLTDGGVPDVLQRLKRQPERIQPGR